ncbi:MAG: HTH domain-containing protein [Deltaproteobacteria bacterium]|nr:HTH domain-containing protein [Deltaproteobacteria bacterium]MBW2127099.1 HTH domain-containing protein [Deltaproteobacteria bacterium]
MRTEDFLTRLEGVHRNANGWIARCPAHNDEHASLAVSEGEDGRILVKCFAGCSTEEIVHSLGLNVKDLFSHGNRRTTAPPPFGLTLEELAKAKKLQLNSLKNWGCSTQKIGGAQVVRVPYSAPDGEELAVRYRCSLSGPNRFRWKKGSKVHLYGLWRLAEFRKAGWSLLVEGETDCWTAWSYNLPALGIPGKSTWKAEWSSYLEGIEVYLWQEPDAQDLVSRVGKDISNLKVIVAPKDVKDISEAHIQGRHVGELIESLKGKATPASQIIQIHKDQHVQELKKKAQPILQSRDPLEDVKKAILSMGYGGDTTPALVTYLALTSRLLAMRPGSMPVHLLLTGQASAGKSFTLNCVLKLLPEEAYHEIAAGSPRVLIYDDAELRHKAVIFGEADSLPAGEDNPAASAIRNLLQDHELHYDVTVKDKQTGEYSVKRIRKAGPSMLVTTSTRRLGYQLDTRVFTLEIEDSREKIRAALAAQAQAEVGNVNQVNESLIAYQAYLQAQAPWEVVVPFVEPLSELIAARATAPRILRDFARLLSLVKSVTILRHVHRDRDEKGRLIAAIDDYKAVFELVACMYETTLTGASDAIRELVAEVVRMLNEGSPPTQSELAKRLGVNRGTVNRRVHAAIRQGWLVNTENRKGYPWRLEEGEPLPEREGLPTPQEIKEAWCGWCGGAGVTGRNKHPSPKHEENTIETEQNLIPGPLVTPQNEGEKEESIPHSVEKENLALF